MKKMKNAPRRIVRPYLVVDCPRDGQKTWERCRECPSNVYESLIECGIMCSWRHAAKEEE